MRNLGGVPIFGGGAPGPAGSPARRGAAGNEQTVIIEDAFRSAATLTHTGDFELENTYDGFDRVIKSTDAVGNVADTDGTLGDPRLDPGGRVILATAEGPIGGATPTNRTGSGNVDLAQSEMRFDEAGRQYESQQDVFAATGVTLPSSRSVTHTGGGLEANSTANTHTSTVTIVNAGSATGNSSYVLARTVFDRAGRAVDVLADNTGQTTTEYDGANRAIQVTDALQATGRENVVQTEYDNNSNVTLVTRTEKSTITSPTTADEVFQSVMRYDALNRLVLTAVQGADGVLDPALIPCDSTALWQVPASALITRLGYDSRSNQTLAIDPKGNTTVSTFDGASRPTQVQEHLRETGQGQNPPAPGETLLPYGGGTIRSVTTDYDGNSRVKLLTDDNGNPTSYAYDTLDRELKMTFQDGSTRQYVYNEASNVITYTDENGSVFANTFDPLGRKTQCAITPAAGVVGTTAQSFEYDGISRATFARDSVSATNADVNLDYDSLSRVLEDSQTFGGNTRNVSNTAFDSYSVTEVTYPDGRTIENTYDLLYRRTLVHDPAGGGTDVAAWEYYGPTRIAECTLGNDLICSHLNNARTNSAVQSSVANPGWGNQSSDRLGYDGAGRLITKRWLAGGVNGGTGAYNNSSSLVGQTTAYDRSSNKFYERALHAESRSSVYEPFDSDNRPTGGYDSINRLRQYQRGVLSTGSGGAVAGGSVTTPISLPGTDESQTYDLDGLGNWKKTVFDPVGGSDTTQIRQHNGLNEITRTDDGTTKVDFEYDGVVGASNGNLKNDGIRLYEWDALNRLKEVSKTPSTPVTIGEYTYDALNRRIRKVVSNGGLSGTIPNGTTDFIYNSNWQCLEERDGSNSVFKQYIWGRYIDELLQQKTFTTINGNAAGEYYPLCDTLYRTLALTDDTGAIVETYDYDPYGNTLIFTAAGTGANWFADDATQGSNPTCEFLFTGRRFDSEKKTYQFRRREYDPWWGRFDSRDPLGYRAGDMNLQQYLMGSPTRATDPTGEIIDAGERALIAFKRALERWQVAEAAQGGNCSYIMAGFIPQQDPVLGVRVWAHLGDCPMLAADRQELADEYIYSLIGNVDYLYQGCPKDCECSVRAGVAAFKTSAPLQFSFVTSFWWKTARFPGTSTFHHWPSRDFKGPCTMIVSARGEVELTIWRGTCRNALEEPEHPKKILQELLGK